MPKKLIIKIWVACLVAIILPILGAQILLQSFNPLILIIIPISAGAAFAGIYFFLKPLEKINSGVELFAKGELDHQVQVTSGDELEKIALELNHMAQRLIFQNQTNSLNKDTASSEKNKLMSIFSSLNEGIIVLDLGRRVVLANSTAQRLTGYSILEMEGKVADEYFKFIDRSGQIIPSSDYCRIPSFSTTDPVKLVGKDKQTSSVKVSVSQITQNPTANLGCVIILYDYSKERQLEAIQLDFVSMASHELRTPLTSIIGYLSIFLKENKEKLNAHQTDFLSRVLVGAKQLGVIINNLLSVSKVERSAFSISQEKINWKEFLQKEITENQLQVSQKNITLGLKLPPENLPTVSGDSVRLGEVLNNLIGNAINYTNEGGKIELSTKLSGNEIITSVSDSGIGIPPDAMPHLFTKFFRVSSALDTSSNSKGTGLGLYISKSIIDLHHGKIWAQSQLNRGSTFSFSLPVA